MRNVPLFLPVLIFSHLRFKMPALGSRSTAVSRHWGAAWSSKYRGVLSQGCGLAFKRGAPGRYRPPTPLNFPKSFAFFAAARFVVLSVFRAFCLHFKFSVHSATHLPHLFGRTQPGAPDTHGTARTFRRPQTRTAAPPRHAASHLCRHAAPFRPFYANFAT